MVLLHDIVQVLDLPDVDGSFRFGVHGFERGLIRSLLSIVTVSGSPFQSIAYSK